ncbi:TPA: hypothetical protein HA332_12075 [Sulfurisphaera tokodaii]|uniref:Calcineurin-like phosphoesterase domain-containing protein n=1 Tax=Sulfurisphaera tokodaii TaxID=111955 RepID=A0A832TSZ0_9CREN|nr:hypothetical protein [Sulfurisphaera tokodaii]
MALVTQVPCREDVIDFLNKLEVDLIVGLGDVECPQYIKKYKGILGEMEDITTQKYLRKNGLLIQEGVLDLFISFSYRKVITHFPPRNPRGSQKVLAEILSNLPEIVFHGHLIEQKVYDIGKTKVVSVGSLEKGYYVVYDGREYELKRSSH